MIYKGPIYRRYRRVHPSFPVEGGGRGPDPDESMMDDIETERLEKEEEDARRN